MSANATPARGRVDLYRGIHKALRAMMAEMLTLAGRLDAGDDCERRETLDRLGESLALAEKHMQLENDFLHPAMEARRPGSSARAAFEHAGHEEDFDRLRAAIAAVRDAEGPERGEAAYRLYLALGRWVAANLLHMEHEELHHNPAFREAYSDEELHALRARMLAKVPPAQMAQYLRWMLAFQDHGERLAQLSGLRSGAPREAYEGALALARAHLPSRDWEKLARSLGLESARAA